MEEVNWLYNDDGDWLIRMDSTGFGYNARWQPYKVKRARSDGQISEQTTYYAEDFNNISGTNIAALKSKHIVGKPLKVVETIGSQTVSGELAGYDTNGKPIQVYRYESDANHIHNPAVYPGSDFKLEETRTYNSQGLLSGFTTHDGISYVYLWSYNFTHPVALISNATETELTAVIGSIETFGALTNESSIVSALSALRGSLAYSLITSAIYYPGIGVKQLISPDGMIFSYEYDGMNRLRKVKDRNGKEVDLYTYQNALTLISN